MPNLPTPVAVPTTVDEHPEQRRTKLNSAWRSYLKGAVDVRIPEHRDILTSTSGADGGALIPQEFNDFVAQSLKYFAPLTQYVRTRNSTNGRPVKVSRVDDTANGMNLIAEGSTASIAEADPTFSSSTVFLDLFSTGQTRYSNELLQDSEFDLVQFLTNLASSRYGRGLERILTRGLDSSGNATPNNPGMVSLAGVGNTTATLSGGIGFAANIVLRCSGCSSTVVGTATGVGRLGR